MVRDIVLTITSVVLSLALINCATNRTLQHAVKSGDVESIEPLVKKGKNINEADTNGKTPLIHAVNHGYASAAQELLRLGADPTVTDNLGFSAIQYASYSKQPDIVKLVNEDHDKIILSKPENYVVIPVFFGTNRNNSSTESTLDIFGTERSNDVKLGICEVSIPRNHKKGVIESPSIFRLEFSTNPSKHFQLNKIVLMEKKPFNSLLRNRTYSSDRKEVLVFIHGYRVSFENAAKRTAQMAYDLDFDGPAVFFSWPSKGSFLGYPADETTISWATPSIKAFIEQVAHESDADTVNLIAHSMGNRALTNALVKICENSNAEIKKKFKQIILAAPDIDRDIFVNDIFPLLSELPSRITLYASSRDKAIWCSRFFHQSPRVGQSGDNLVILSGMDTVDATKVETSFSGHSYYSDSRKIISDIYYAIKKRLPPIDRFGLELVTIPTGKYWRMVP